ncbi:MAG: hypothetical protein HOM01_13250 [Kordiimonadaceae bacterium]|nr:hypothetical protein [Kordiimonadaceae bacterium]
MSGVKKEARLSGMLLARKGTAAPSHTDHRLTVQVMEQFSNLDQQEAPFKDVNANIEKSSDSFTSAVSEVKSIRDRQNYNTVIENAVATQKTIEASNKAEVQLETAIKKEVSADTNVNLNNDEQVSSDKEHKVSAKKNVSANRIAMTLRMEQDKHLKLRLYAAHSRKSCQDIISAALDAYLCRDKELCSLSNCKC